MRLWRLILYAVLAWAVALSAGYGLYLLLRWADFS